MSLVSHRAVRVLAEHLAREPRLEGAAVDELCRAHPDLEAGLRRLARARSEAEIEAPEVAITPGKGPWGKKLLRGAASARVATCCSGRSPEAAGWPSSCTSGTPCSSGRWR